MNGGKLKSASLAMASAIGGTLALDGFITKNRAKAKLGMSNKKIAKNRAKNKKARKARKK